MIPTKKEIVWFLLIAFGFSWLTWWGLYVGTGLSIQIIVLIGAFGPSLAGSYMSFRENGWKGLTTLWKRGFEWRMTGKSYMFGLFFLPALFLIAYWWSDGEEALFLERPWLVVPTFLYMLFVGGTIQEEYGWRGYLLDACQLKTTPIKASLFVGVTWAIWHTPLFFMDGTGQSLIPFWAYGMAILAFTFVISWLYNVTTMNLWSVFLLHTMFNVCFALIPLTGLETFPIGFLHLTLLLITSAIVLVWQSHGNLGYDHLEQLEAVEGSHQSNVMAEQDAGKD